MPRLTVWFAGAALSTATYFTYQSFLHTSHHSARRETESAVLAAKLTLQSVMQRYALLLRQEQTVQGRSEGAGVTNCERLMLYCELQQLRELFLALPLRAQTAAEKLAILRRLDEVERNHCTTLNFRDVALTLWQVLTCQVCFGLYVLSFCVVDPLLRHFHSEAAERVRRVGLHAVSRWITQSLCIPVNMTFEEAGSHMYHTGAAGTTRRTHGDHEGVGVLYLVFSPQHWIELVGFWACPTNPLLYSTHVRLLTPPFHCSAVPFEDYWQSRQTRVDANMRVGSVEEGAACNVNGRDVKTSPHELGLEEEPPMLQSSFGYPLALCITERGRDTLAVDTDVHLLNGSNNNNNNNNNTTVRLLPVVSAGLPRTLYVDNAMARRDVRVTPNLSAVYAHLHNRQYPMRPRMSSSSTSDVAMGTREATTEDARVRGVCEELCAWHRRSGIPPWYRVVWGAVYGGVGRDGKYDRRALTFRLGRPCTTEELTGTQLRTQHDLLCMIKRDLE